MNFFEMVLFKKKGIKKSNRKKKLQTLSLSELKKIESQRFSRKKFNELILIFRTLTANILNIKTQLTDEEIKSELKKRKIKRKIRNRINKLSSDITKIKFSNEKITKQEYNKIESRLKKIIKII